MILTAHGSADPRSAAVARAVAGRIRRLRPWLDVEVAFLEQTDPNLRDVLAATTGGVVVPFLLANAYHARVDIPSVIEASGGAVRQAAVLGEDPALLAVLRHRLAEAGASPTDPGLGVVVVAVGSSNAVANAQTATISSALAAGTRWAGTHVAFATGPRPDLDEAVRDLQQRGAQHVVIAPWFLAPGRITDRVSEFAARQGLRMSAPLGSHNLVAATVLDRFDDVIAAGTRCESAA
ncbi:sirohydrochlorin chelatase [Mycolicibacterium komossense]|uniref:Sirohydrochlorin chelatase n=1 Tax=Mycolicibacterium komossense TaxID=1779 RepID=A0ABT3C607_9MYCO|nr:sirohydrochlorin chelatase [Mycolicibacterium komossense]MCV7224850.1 sirohydrochlorin chelatase [Mycolicibacterium komossense]